MQKQVYANLNYYFFFNKEKVLHFQLKFCFAVGTFCGPGGSLKLLGEMSSNYSQTRLKSNQDGQWKWHLGSILTFLLLQSSVRVPLKKKVCCQVSSNTYRPDSQASYTLWVFSAFSTATSELSCATCYTKSAPSFNCSLVILGQHLPFKSIDDHLFYL